MVSTASDQQRAQHQQRPQYQQRLRTSNGLSTSNGLMTTDDGRTQIAYLVRCALPAGASLVKQDQYGVSYTFAGELGLAPAWATGACDTNCQEAVSACLEAHVNTAGIHVPLWIVSANPYVGWGLDPNYPNQEATFFGNIFQLGAHGAPATVAPAYYCAGPQVQLNPPGGSPRFGAGEPALHEPARLDVRAVRAESCAAADYPYQADGFKACLGWNNPVTVWRQNTSTPTTGTGGTTGSSGTGGAAGTGGATGTGSSSGTGGTGTKPPPPPPPPPHGKKIVT